MRYPALVCVHPGNGVKEQTAGIYAAHMAARGYVALAFDASGQGDSDGQPRGGEEPSARVEDIRCAVDYLTTWSSSTSVGSVRSESAPAPASRSMPR